MVFQSNEKVPTAEAMGTVTLKGPANRLRRRRTSSENLCASHASRPPTKVGSRERMK